MMSAMEQGRRWLAAGSEGSARARAAGGRRPRAAASSAGAPGRSTARAGNRRFGPLSARRAHAKAPWKTRVTMENATGA